MSGIRVTEGTATVELDAVELPSTASGARRLRYYPPDLLAATARALDAAGETVLADQCRELARDQ